MSRLESRNDEFDVREHMLSLAPVLAMLPPGTQVCFVEDGDDLLLYNINKAFELIEGRSPTARVDVAQRAQLIQPRGPEPPPDDAAVIDPEHAQGVDLSYPVLLLESKTELDGTPGRIIDGWHRIYRASQLGIAELPAIVITPEDEEVIRINPRPARS
jgi:hypothetical protein